MQMSQLVPLSSLAQRFGVKSIIYGPPGSYKTPLIQTAPRPVALITEPGVLSARNLHHIPAWEGYTAPRIDEFFQWIFNSPESRNFDTVCIDSGSQMAESFLIEEQAKGGDGRRHFLLLSQRIMKIMMGLYYMQAKHIYIIAKQGSFEESGTTTRRPFFPGQDLNVKIPHLFDEILYISVCQVPGIIQPTLAIRCKPTYGILARDRSARLNELEYPDLTQLFFKCMS